MHQVLKKLDHCITVKCYDIMLNTSTYYMYIYIYNQVDDRTFETSARPFLADSELENIINEEFPS